ncbi:FMN-dependent oxidoreductase, nitrilotriacetate monooxygenase family [Arboricoccus pini]|uniref:FMN-dependent oxidoreductase, nitrilotriacetate monooxygenase family n=1 Tax=Arboricoccus pini TaxID=1963835 RepID=A0A212RUX2_9PROT|nr:NtaA/DmoA family FMN-dependent monooxygenase [Arboricoccus pini]SNB76457.1 FMN-dependent oxidoreductase, nitrilotriacetate monooxygenase family [Arboricoccus pini]
MADKRFHLGWFLAGSSVQAWGEPWSGNIGKEWMVPDFFVDVAKLLEKACFDYVLLEDSSYVGESFGGSRDIYLKNGLSVPRQDPSVVASLMMAATRRIGIVPTLATFAYPPYLLARLVATLDQVSQGRAGWNMVTGSSDFAARNFGLDGMPPHDQRYDMADEYMEVVNGLWDSFEPGAIVADPESGVLIDPAKVHAIDYAGQYYKSRGPLNSGPCVQGRPVIAQAGGSPRGRQFASRHADTIIAATYGIEAMKAYREDVRARAKAQGRDPDTIKVLFLISPTIGETEEEAQRLRQRRLERQSEKVEQRLAFLGKITNIDFGKMDLDTPVSALELKTNGHQQSLDEFKQKAGNRTLRQAMNEDTGDRSLELVGTPEQIARRMGEAMAEVGGDGFLVTQSNTSRRSLSEITDGLVPALQRQGLMRREWAHDHFRDNLLEF